MSHDKKTGTEHFTGKPEDAARLVQAVESSETQRRIASLENSVSNLDKNLLERHARLITLIFTAVSLVVGLSSLSVAILSSSSRADSREATKEMKQDVKDKLDEIEMRFQSLAGESLKKPLLQISTAKGPLDGQEFEFSQPYQALPIYPVFVKNDGDKRSDPLSIRLFSSTDIRLNGGYWQSVESNDKDYPFSYYLTTDSRTMGIGVAPKETWTLSSDFGGQFFSTTFPVNCKLLIFYGAEAPAEAKFVIKLKK